MMTSTRFRRSNPVLIGLVLLLASCASRVAAVAPEQTVSVVSGNMTRGVITATRPVDNPASIQTGFDGVLAALHEPAGQPPATATEYVVQRSDDTTVSIVTSTGSFSMGERVEIIDGLPPELLPAN
jgi:P pilus assembly chaperone PapD